MHQLTGLMCFQKGTSRDTGSRCSRVGNDRGEEDFRVLESLKSTHCPHLCSPSLAVHGVPCTGDQQAG